MPEVDLVQAPRIFRALHQAMQAGLVRSCHDLSEGGLAVALAEMAIAGGLGVRVKLDRSLFEPDWDLPYLLLFSESPTRFLLEVAPEDTSRLKKNLSGCPLARIGKVVSDPRLVVKGWRDSMKLIDAPLEVLREAWLGPLRW